MKIFQAYYKEEQRSQLDQEFTPYDNTANPVVNLHEYYIYTKIYQEAMMTNEDLWGHFSWQWKRKLENVPAAQILEIINTNPGADVYTFHPFPWEAAIAWNVWEQGQWCHPHIIELAEKIFEGMGLDPKVIMSPMGSRDYLCVNYFVGNKNFWDGLLAWLHRFVDVCGRLSDDQVDLLNSKAGYEANPNLDYRGFICERLISSFLVYEQERVKVRPFIEIYNARISNELKELVLLKDRAIDTKDKSLLVEFLDKRKGLLRPQDKDWGQEWIDKCVL
jgi:hypothetical protein